jgi:molecular chaperone DnaK
MTASQKLGEKMYADAQGAAGAAGAEGGPSRAAEPPRADAGPADDNVVDADFKEVKDRK